MLAKYLEGHLCYCDGENEDGAFKKWIPVTLSRCLGNFNQKCVTFFLRLAFKQM